MNQKKQNLTKGLMVVMFSVGIGLILFPIVSNLYHHITASKTINTYEKQLKQASMEEKAQFTERMHKHNQRLEKGEETVNDPFSATTPSEVLKDSESVSIYENLGAELGDVIGHVTIPQINVELPIYSGTSELQLKKGAGLIRGTSFPIGGSGTHSVISAHRGLPTAELFTDLPKLVLGDVFYIESFDQTLAYEVDQIKVVKPDNVEDIQIQPGKDFLTLLTCTPYMVNTDRLLVRGKRVPYNEVAKKQTVKTVKRQETFKKGGIFCLILLALLLIYWRKKRRK